MKKILFSLCFLFPWIVLPNLHAAGEQLEMRAAQWTCPTCATEEVFEGSTKKVVVWYQYFVMDQHKRPKRDLIEREGLARVPLSLEFLRRYNSTDELIQKLAEILGINNREGLRLRVGEDLQEGFLKTDDVFKVGEMVMYSDYSGLR